MKENLQLLLLFMCLSAVILIRVTVEENNFTTPDSLHYMAAAQSLLKNGSLEYVLYGKDWFFSLWPAGYSASIALLSGLTSLSLLWSSKLVNLLWLAFAFLLLRKYFTTKSAWVSIIFCSNSLLDLFSYTWSEAGFLVALLWCSFLLHRLFVSPATLIWIQFILASMSLFLYRYIGGFILGVIALSGVFALLNRQYKQLIFLALAGAVCALGVGSYFWFIYHHTGFYSGATRLAPDEPLFFLLQNLLEAQANELFLIRKMSFANPDWLALILLFVQVSLLSIACYRIVQVTDWRRKLVPQPSDSLALSIAFVGATYWLTVVTLRLFINKFDLFDFRILAPASALLFVSLHAYFAAEQRALILQKIRLPLTTLYLLALMHGLYKKQLLLLFLG